MYQQNEILRGLVIAICTLFLFGQSFGQSCGYGFSKTITIDHNKVSGTAVLQDFPVLISLTDTDLRTTANGGDVENANGYDIVFVDEGSGQRLAHQVERYVATTGNYVAWVRVPKVYPQFDTRIKILYGNAQVSADPSTSQTWDDNYQAVWHLHDDVLDGSQQGNDGTNSGSSDQAGKIADGRGFDGSTDHIYRTDATWNGDVPALSGGSPDEFTLSGWINVDNLNNRQPLLSKQGSGTGNDRGFVFMMEDNNELKIELFKNNDSGTRTEVYSSSTLTAGTWYYMVATYRFVTDGTSECSVYLDGVEEGSTATALGPIFTNSRDVEIGRYFWNGSTNYWMDGEIDEVRISNTVRSAGWIATEYENQNDPSSFYSVGSEVAGITNPAIPVCGAGFKKVITIDEGEIPGTTSLTDFPVLINMTDNDLRTTGNGGNVENTNGWDITFTDENLVPLDHDLESYDASTGELVAWVKVPSLPATVDYDIYMFYGNADVFVDPSTPCTWTDFHGVWHLHDDFLDATTNDEDGSNNGSTDNGSSQIADGQSFDGGDFIELSSFPNLTTDFTITGWIRTTDNTEGGQRIFCDDENNSGGYAFSLADGGTGRLRFYSRSMNGVILDGSTNSIANNTWYYVAGVVDRTNQDRFIYINGVQEAADLTDGGTWGTDAGDASIGGETAAGETGNRFEGALDEIRVASTVRSADWLVAEYNNQSNPSNFYAVGSEENLAATSTQNGDWDLTATWNGGAVPTDGANVNIQHLVDLEHSDLVLCNLTVESSDDVDSRLDVEGPYSLTVTEDLLMYSNASTAVDARLRTQVGSARITVQGDLIAEQTSGDDLFIQVESAGDSLIIEGNLVMSHSGGNNMEVTVNNATAGLRVEGNFIAELTAGTDDAFDLDLNDGEIRVLGTTSLRRYDTFGDLHLDFDGGNLRTDSLYISSSGGSGTDQVMLDIDGTSELNVDGDFQMDMGGGDDHWIYLNINAGTSAELNVGGNLIINKTGGDDLLIIVDEANSELNVGGKMVIESSGAEETAFDLNDGSLTVGDSLVFRQLDGGQLMEFDMDGTPIVNLGTFVATLDNNGNQELLIDLDDSAIMNVTNDVVLTINDGNDLELHLGQESVGATPQLNVGGDMLLDHNPAAGGDDIQFIISDVSNVDITGTFTMATDGTSAGNFYTRLDGNSTLTVGSNIVFTGANGSNEIELEMNDNSDLEIGGNFVRDGVPNNYGLLQSNSTNARITYNGSIAQIFADDNGAGTDGIEYEKVVINNTFNTEPQLTMEGAVTLTNEITFTDGVLQTTSTNLLTIADNAIASEGNANSYVSGPIQKVGDDDFVFPLGNAGIWARLEIAGATGAAITDAFTAEYIRQPYSESFYDSNLYVGDNGGLYNTSTLEYWELDRDVGTAQPIISIYWENNDSSVINDTMELVVAHYTGSNTWANEGGVATGTPGAGKVSTGGNINSFSPFTFGSTSATLNPLPVELLHFTAIPSDDAVHLNWSTASEVDNDYFTVERSQDGKVYMPIGTVSGNGTSTVHRKYELWDLHPHKGTSYYRLRQTDFDGSSELSDVRQVRFLSGDVFALYPNPAQTILFATIPMTGSLTNSSGQTVMEIDDKPYIDVSHLSKGVYYFHQTGGNVEKIVLE